MAQLSRVGFIGSLGAARRGGSAALTDSAFVASGCTSLWYNTTTPSAVYHAGTDRSYTTWEGFNRFKRVVLIKYRFHDSANAVAPATEGPAAAWSQDYYISDATLSDDDHGVPNLAVDADGYLHVIFGAHVNPFQYMRSTNANDPSAWSSGASLSAKGDLSYPHLKIIGTNAYLFARGYQSDTPGPWIQGYLSLIRGTISAGVITWGSREDLVNYGAPGVPNEISGRFYFGNCEISADQKWIYIPSAWSNDDDTSRRDVYAYKYATHLASGGDTAGDLVNLQGTRRDAIAARPVSLTTAKASYRIIDQETGGFVGTTPCVCLDASGNPHYIYTEVLDGGSGGNVKHRYWNGSSFSSPAVIASLPASTTHHYDGAAAYPNADGSITAQFTSGSSSFIRGGDQYRATWTSGGGWGAAALLMSSASAAYNGEGEQALDVPVVVQNAHPALVFIWGQRTYDAAVEIGKLRGFGNGVAISSPLIGTRYSADTDSLIKRMPTEPTAANCRVINTFIKGMRADGLWTDLYQLWVPFAHSSGAALVPWRTNRYPLTVTGSPVFTAYGGYKAVSGGYWDTGIPVNSLPDTNFMLGAVINPNTSGSALAGTITTPNNLNFACNPSSSLAFNKAASAGTVTSANPASGVHLAIGQRSGTTQTVYLDDTLKATNTATNSASNTETVLWGRRQTTSSDATFYIMFISLAVVNATWAGLMKARTQTFINSITPGTW